MEKQDHHTAPSARRVRPTGPAPSKAPRALPLLLLGALAVAAAILFSLALQGLGSTAVAIPAAPLAKPFTTSDPAIEDPAPAPTDQGPNRLRIPSVGLDIELTTIAAAQKELVLPSSDKAGITTQTASLAASAGTTLITGHVNFVSGADAPMALIKKAARGAKIFVTDAAGTVYAFIAETLDDYPKQALPDWVYDTEGPRQLALATCGGAIGMVNGQRTFVDNTILTATPNENEGGGL